MRWESLPKSDDVGCTIDSNIFLWNYDNSSDVAYYDGLTETILGVGLIKPKKGVFKDYIKYLLCLTTSVEIVILGVTFTEEDVPGALRPSEVIISDLLLIPEAHVLAPNRQCGHECDCRNK